MDFSRGSSARRLLWLTIIALLIGFGLALGFRAPPVLVDSAVVTRGALRGTLEEEGRTRVRDRFDVMAPVSGQLGRVLLEPGDAVRRGQRLFSVSPLAVAPLDARAQAQAQAALAAAEDAARTAQAQIGAEAARAALAAAELQRVEQVVRAGLMPRASLDQAQAAARQTAAALSSARFAVQVARHQRDNARAALAVGGGLGQPLVVVAPVDGTVLARRRQSEGPVQAGEPILSLGDLASLEVAVDVLSADAVRLRPGLRVEIDRWGGAHLLHGRVRRIEPAGFTKVSALGVEEQRVWVIVDLDEPAATRPELGDGYRVEARFLLWESGDSLQVPVGALFREAAGWAVYVITDGRARKRVVVPGRRAGLMTEVVKGLQPGEKVILHPGQDVAEGMRIRLH